VIIWWWILSIQSTSIIPCTVWACDSVFNIHESRWNDQEVQEGITALKDVAYQRDVFIDLRVIAIGRRARNSTTSSENALARQAIVKEGRHSIV